MSPDGAPATATMVSDKWTLLAVSPAVPHPDVAFLIGRLDHLRGVQDELLNDRVGSSGRP